MRDPADAGEPSNVEPDGSELQVDPPHFDGVPPHPGTPMGSVWVTGNAARRVGGERLRFWFRLAIVVGLVVIALLALRSGI